MPDDAAVIRILYEVEARLNKRIDALDAGIDKDKQDILAAIAAEPEPPVAPAEATDLTSTWILN
jgi:hypothetical protein